MKISFWRLISRRSSSSVGSRGIYFAANSSSFPFRMEYFAISSSVSDHKTILIVEVDGNVVQNIEY